MYDMPLYLNLFSSFNKIFHPFIQGSKPFKINKSSQILERVIFQN